MRIRTKMTVCAAVLALGCGQAGASGETTAVDEKPMDEELVRTEGEETMRVVPGLAVLGVSVACDQAGVFFPTDSAELDEADQTILRDFARCVRGEPTEETIEITARTDPRASEEYNRELAQERARAVLGFLEQQGVDPERIEIRAMGERGMTEGMPTLWPLQRRAVVETVDDTE
ncbi:MAG: OmpA family protein [Myxococcota bacterium]|nr:OmpA family protein [Myxococcota bacterium]